MTLPPEIHGIARRSPGALIDNRQVQQAGFGPWDLTEWVRSGLLERLVLGQYRIAADPVPPLQSLHVAQAYLARRQRNCDTRQAPDSLITHAGGAYLLASTNFLPPFIDPIALIDHDRRVRIGDAPFRVQHAHLRQMAALRPAGLWVPPSHRVLLDLAADETIPTELLRTTAQEVLRATRATSLELERAIKGVRGWGAARLHTLLAEGSLDVESPKEWQIVHELFGQHPPAPDCQVLVTPRWRVDFAFLFAGLVLEYYGLAWHRDRVDEDACRVHSLERDGMEVIVITKGVLRDTDGLAAHVHDVRRYREREMLAGRLRRPALPVQPDRRVPLRTLVPLG